MALPQFGTNSAKRRKRVYYTGTDTIYEGMAVCYDQDATTNVLGWDKANGERGTTTAEGYQNEGKFLRVEKPSTSNIKFYAGHVACCKAVGKTGPQWIDIYTPNGAIIPVRGTESFTIGDKIYLANGDYEVTNVPTTVDSFIGYAMETVDRSSTEGLLLAKVVPSGIASSGVFGAGSTILSSAIWSDVDMDRLRNDPSYGFIYEDDFMGPIDVTSGDGWTLTQVDTKGSIEGDATAAGGVLNVTSATGDSADDGINAQLKNCMVKPAAGVTVCFEARVKMSDATQQYYLGLGGVDTTLIASGVLDDTVDKAGFYHEAASTDNKISSVTARTSSDDKTADVADNTDDTWMTLGLRIDGLSSVKFYVNGVLVETGTTAASIPNAVMCLSAAAQYETADGVMSIDWVKVAQVGGRDA